MARVNIQQLLGLPGSSAAGLPPGSEPELAEGELPPVGLAAAGIAAAAAGIAAAGSAAPWLAARCADVRVLAALWLCVHSVLPKGSATTA